MTLSSNNVYINSIDPDETLDSFSLKHSKVFRLFLNQLNQNQLWKKLVDVAFEKNIFKSNLKAKIYNPHNDALFVINEFKRVNCTVGLLCSCMKDQDLQHLLGLLGVFEKIHVIKQPGEPGFSIVTANGGELTLSYVVGGYPRPSYQWYHNESAINGAIKPTLTISNFGKESEGLYHCKAVQSYSNVHPVSLTSNTVDCILLARKPQFLIGLPPEMVVTELQEVRFYVQADEEFHGSYEWHHSKKASFGKIIYRSMKNEFCIPVVTTDHEGIYKCVIKNSAGETFSEGCNLKVEVPLKPAAKVALLIGNSQYTNFTCLKTPSQDVMLLTHYLRKIGFFVATFINISVSDFRNILNWFYSIIIKKSLVLFYFSGHGFELSNNKFILPVDCPPSSYYTLEDCIPHQLIIQEIMKKKPLLLVSVLDMCLKGPNRITNPRLYSENIEHYDYDLLESSIVEACATSDNQIAYERKKGDIGLYCKCLCECISQDVQVVKIFEQAHAEFIKKGICRQRPQLKYNVGKSDIRLYVRPERDVAQFERKIARFKSKCFIEHLRIIDIYLLFMVVPDDFILNSFDVYILPLSSIAKLKFVIVCPELSFTHQNVITTTMADSVSYLKMTVDGLLHKEDCFTLHFRCSMFCDKKERNVYDYAKFNIKWPCPFF